jgi:hypothetical protein
MKLILSIILTHFGTKKYGFKLYQLLYNYYKKL